MKKISILTIMLSGIVFGLFTFVLEGKAQDKNDKTTTVPEIDKFVHQLDSELKEGNFSCESCFYDNDDLIGYQIKFKQNGVTAHFNLIRINTSTGKFTTGSYKGIFLEKNAEVTIQKKEIDKKIVEYSADEIIAGKDNLILKGNARILFPKNEKLEADRLTILLE